MAASLCRSGGSVETGDLFADFDTCQLAPTTRLLKYPWSAISWLRASPVNAWCYTGGLENYPRLIGRMAAVRPLLGNSPDTLRYVRDPFHLARLAAENGFLFPKSASVLDHSSRDRWLSKPFRSAGGLQIQRHVQEQEPSRCSYWQQELEGVPMSLAVLSNAHEWKLIGVSQLQVGAKYDAPGEFVFAGATSVAWSELGCEGELRELITMIHESANLVGLWGIDYIQADRPVMLEVNPRWTATMPLYERVTGTSLMPWHLMACREHSLCDFSPVPGRCSGVRIVYATQAIVWTDDHRGRLAEEFALSRESSLAKPVVADIPTLGTRIEVGHPICSIYADGATAHDVEAQIQQRVKIVRGLLA
ncbi:ATP-grasp domain-containing protein [Bremerella cremea]|uniref:ATP-grasp domain-containing protein n=1 Tax=Bremerella cremea TaxID=1031537 RepID=A0A368KRX5_9BACT|nr:ATP-grasp domain-containing protein [Bremerella cremea]RCS50599.1 ATP-grasp domain-containing protein [Bremerella cremea]